MPELTHIEDGKAAVYKREGTYHARIRIDGKYIHRTLKTGDLAVAIKAAQKLVHKFEFSVEHGIPIDAKTFAVVIDEYVKFRRKENVQGRTSDGMLRQIERVVRAFGMPTRATSLSPRSATPSFGIMFNGGETTTRSARMRRRSATSR